MALLGPGFLIGLVFIYVGAKKYRLGRRIKNTATERIRSVAVGRTEVTGTCRDAGITYEKPYADGECVYRKWQVEEYRESTGSSDDGPEWVVVDGNTDVAPFFLEDDTGEILVDTTDAPAFEISTENSYVTTVDRGEQPPPEVESFSPDSAGMLETVAGGVDPGKAISKLPGMGAAEGMFGGHTISEMTSAEYDPEESPDKEKIQQEYMQQYFDEDLLDEDGQLREDVTQEEFMAAMGDDMQEMNPTDMFSEMVESASESDLDGDGQPQQGPPDVVQELGATGSNADRLKLGEEELTGQFVVADQDESGIIKHYSRRGPVYIGIGLLVSAASLAGILVGLGVG